MKLTRKWFTLVEMLIVIVIIGILAAALIPRLTGIQARARDTARKADLNQISTSLSTYALDHNAYPVHTSWTAITTGGTAGALTGLATYMTAIPKETSANWMGYQYQSNPAGGVFVIASVSEGGWVNANWSGGASATATSVPAAITIGTSPVSGCTPGAAACIGTSNVGYRYILSN